MAATTNSRAIVFSVFFIVLTFFVCLFVFPFRPVGLQPLCRFIVRLPFVGTHRMRPPVALADTRGVSLQGYRTTNFRVISPMLMKYMPCGKSDTLICWVSTVMLPVITVWPIRLVMR